jgi:DNA-binding MarR family transcriptional regulator
MNFYQTLGPLVLGTRLKRLSDYFLAEVNKVYADQEIPFEASWFGVFYLLDEQQKMSIFEIAEKLEVSHSAISQVIKALETKKLIQTKASDDDARKKIITLSTQGIELLNKIKPIWHALNHAMENVMIENPVLKNLLTLEKNFTEIALNQRVKNQINV